MMKTEYSKPDWERIVHLFKLGIFRGIAQFRTRGSSGRLLLG